jgi:hypothetical protein
MSSTRSAGSRSAPPGGESSGTAGRSLSLALVVIATAQLMVVLDATIVNVALPHIERALGFSGRRFRYLPGVAARRAGGQGAGGAMIAPAALALIATTFAEGRARNRAMGVYAAMSGGGAVGARQLAQAPGPAGPSRGGHRHRRGGAAGLRPVDRAGRGAHRGGRHPGPARGSRQPGSGRSGAAGNHFHQDSTPPTRRSMR